MDLNAVIICLLVMNIVIFYLASYAVRMQKAYYRLNFLAQQSQAYRSQLEFIMSSNKEIRTLKHDMNNHLLVISELAELGQNEEIRKYAGSLINTVKSTKQYLSTGNIVIDSLINYKLAIAEKLMEMEIRLDIKVPAELGMEDSDLSVVIGNLMDNAIDALEKCVSDRFIEISMKLRKGVFIMEISNPYTGDLCIKKSKLISSKSDGKDHGIGLHNVSSIVDKYYGKMKLEYEDNVFKVRVMMYMNEY